MVRKAVQGGSVRGPMYQVIAAPNIAGGLSIPAPVGGWDALSPIAAMPATNAITLDNMFPQPGYIEIRKGHRVQNDLAPETGAVESLMAYHGGDPTTDKLWAAAGTSLYDVTVTASATITAALTGLSNARFQHLNVSTSGGEFLWACNGVDEPIYYDGSAWTTTTITGVSAGEIISAAVFKGRIWLVMNNQINAAYLPLDSIQGTAATFDLTGVFRLGGFLQAIGSWSVDGGSGPADYLAFVSSRGEVAIYQGIDPTATDDTGFSLVNVFAMGAPIGRRCLTKVGSDLAVVCIDGVVPLSKALITDRAAVLSISITKAIQPVMNQSGRAYGSNFGWQLIAYPRGTRAILNVPLTENVEQQQYIMNTITGAWCRFKGENANVWEVFQDRLFFGGNDAKVYEADCQGFDEGGTIDFDIKTAFNYCGSQGQLKQFMMARALLTTDGQISPGMTVNVDFADSATVDVITSEINPQDLWDVALWDGGTWPETQHITTDWVSVAGIGYCASIRMSGSVSSELVTDAGQNLILQINGWDMLVQQGAFL